MKIFDTPNPNALKIIIDHKLKTGINITDSGQTDIHFINEIIKISGVNSVFTGPDFLTVMKQDNQEWEPIKSSINLIFDKLK
tara:strand:+ start:7580 stop:7825 length:246 start_codon:yes stop_codon:yes gene_type:complete